MSSKHPPPENQKSDCRSQSSLLPPQEGTREDATRIPNPADLTKTSKDNHSDARGTHGDTSSIAKASNNIVAVSGSPKDIICGRGLHVLSHHGNHNLHLMVDRYRQTYLTSTRNEKAAITRRIVQQLKSTGARFLRRLNDVENCDDKKWVEVDDSTAYKKVGHALRLRKPDGGHQLHSLQQHQMDNNSQPLLHLTTARITEAPGISQNVAAMPLISGSQNAPMQHHHSFGISPSPPMAVCPLPLQMALPSPLENQLQMATNSQSHQLPTQPNIVGIQQPVPSILPHLSALGGHGNAVIDPQVFSQVFTSTLALMAQSPLQYQQLQQQQLQQQPLFNSDASSADSHSSRFNQNNPKEERKGNR